MQIVEIPIAFPGILRKLFPKVGKSFCKGKRKGPYTSWASAMLFVFEINLVMKLFVQAGRFRFHVKWALLQAANRRVQKQNHSKIHSLLSR